MKDESHDHDYAEIKGYDDDDILMMMIMVSQCSVAAE